MKALRLLTILSVCCVIGTLGALVSDSASNAAWAAEPAPAPAANESATPRRNESATSATEQPAERAAPNQGTQNQSAQNQGTRNQGTQEEAAAPAQTVAKPKGSGKGGSPERFVPSEQVRADFDVSFPIDI